MSVVDIVLLYICFGLIAYMLLYVCARLDGCEDLKEKDEALLFCQVPLFNLLVMLVCAICILDFTFTCLSSKKLF